MWNCRWLTQAYWSHMNPLPLHKKRLFNGANASKIDRLKVRHNQDLSQILGMSPSQNQ
jgi:hypothetical protein